MKITFNHYISLADTLMVLYPPACEKEGGRRLCHQNVHHGMAIVIGRNINSSVMLPGNLCGSSGGDNMKYCVYYGIVRNLEYRSGHTRDLS